MAIDVSVTEGSYARVPCALVLEDRPVGEDSRLDFESFPTVIEEVYSLVARRQIGADRMPQPGGVAYRGGNWSNFNLELEFRAGQVASPTTTPTEDYSRTQDERDLQEMERKARWCQALGFPLQRDLAQADQQRIMRTVSGLGSAVLSADVQKALSNLERNDPPKVLVVFGSWMVIRGDLENVSLQFMGPWDPETARPSGCKVNLSIQPLLVEYPTWQTVREGPWSFQAAGITPEDVFPTAAAAQNADRQAAAARDSRALGQASPPPGTPG